MSTSDSDLIVDLLTLAVTFLVGVLTAGVTAWAVLRTKRHEADLQIKQITHEAEMEIARARREAALAHTAQLLPAQYEALRAVQKHLAKLYERVWPLSKASTVGLALSGGSYEELRMTMGSTHRIMNENKLYLDTLDPEGVIHNGISHLNRIATRVIIAVTAESEEEAKKFQPTEDEWKYVFEAHEQAMRKFTELLLVHPPQK